MPPSSTSTPKRCCWLHDADPDGAAAGAAGDAERSRASVSETIDGTVIVDATLTGVDARVIVDESCVSATSALLVADRR